MGYSIASQINLAVTGSSFSSVVGTTIMVVTWLVYGQSLAATLYFAICLGRLRQDFGSRARALLTCALALSVGSNAFPWLAIGLLWTTAFLYVPFFLDTQDYLIYAAVRVAALGLPIVMVLALVRISHAARHRVLVPWLWWVMTIRVLTVLASLLASAWLIGTGGGGRITVWMYHAAPWTTAIETWSQQPIQLVLGILMLHLARHIQSIVLPRAATTSPSLRPS